MTVLAGLQVTHFIGTGQRTGRKLSGNLRSALACWVTLAKSPSTRNVSCHGSVHPSIMHQSFIHLSFIHSSIIHPSFSPSIHSFLLLSIHRYIHPFITHPSLYPSIHATCSRGLLNRTNHSVKLPFYLFICLYITFLHYIVSRNIVSLYGYSQYLK